MLEDVRLIREFKAGSSEALCRIYDKYFNYLLTIAVSLVNDVNTAEDIVHDVFCSFIKSRHKFKKNGSLKGYLGTCVANLARDNIRLHKRRSERPAEALEASVDEVGPGQLVMFSEQSRRIASALAMLPYEQREAVILHLYAGMKFREIASHLSVSIDTVKSRYRYGLSKLRSTL